MSNLSLVVTTAGRIALVNAQHNGTDQLIISHCGISATAVMPHPDLTALPNEVKRLSTLSGEAVAADTIHLLVRDETPDIYTMRSLALYTDDGTLFAVYGQATPIMEKSADAILMLAVDAKFVDVDAEAISFGNANFLNPPATETRQGVIEIASQAEATAGNDDVRALTAKKAKAALLAWLLAQDGAGSGVDADLLDGKQAAAFVELVNFTGAAVLSRLLSVDGAGSGMDADLLDGQHGSYYTNIIARLGFTPLNVTAYTAADVLAKLLTVDGSGSGIDADRLNGQAASYFTNIIARLGFTPLNVTAYTAADVLAKLLTVDGSGSGIDADTVDGAHLADILPTQSFGASGWCRLSNGMIFQWGRISVNANSYGTITFPIAFPTSCFHAHAAVATEVGNNDAQANGPMVYAVNSTAANVYNAATTANAWWLALGY